LPFVARKRALSARGAFRRDAESRWTIYCLMLKMRRLKAGKEKRN
jgi:hypothetical protein